MIISGQGVVLIFVTVLGLSFGQILFKLAASELPPFADWTLTSFFSRWLISAFFVYFAATACWVLALRITPLRLAYPLAALGFVVVPILAHYMLGETLRPSTLIGSLVIVAGVLISVWWG